ncbi:MAG: nucleotidyltransferase family protein [Deferribacterales bacterium]
MMKDCIVVIKSDTTYQDLVAAVERGGYGFAAAVDENMKLLGIVTDGDIRRCVLQGDFSLDKLLNKTPYIWKADQPEKAAIAYLKRIHRRQIPVVDENGVMVKILSLDDSSFLINDNPVVLMAGGLGTRLRPLTEKVPKPMLKIGDKPIIEHLIESFVKSGFVNFFITVNYLAEQLRKYFGNGSAFGINIEYVDEKKRMGTAGSLALISHSLNMPFYVANGDIMTNLDFSDMLSTHINSGNDLTVCVKKNEYSIPYGVVEIDAANRVSSIREKPIYDYYVSSGIYILESTVLRHIPQDSFFDMPDLIRAVINDSGIVSPYRFDGYWTDIGHLKSYNEAKIIYEGNDSK